MVSFGVMTAPQNVGYAEVARVWAEADATPEIEHAWLFDHLMPIGGDLDGPILEGWTLLAALAAQTRRLRLGLLVTSNRIRPPALLAKIATTVDVVSDGRLDLGIGVGSRPDVPWARREYDAFGLPYVETREAITALREALPLIRRIWSEDAPFDVDGEVVRVTGAFQNPKPVQSQGPPVMVGGRSAAVLRIAAEHADLWNIPAETSTTPSPAAGCSTGTARTSDGTRRTSPARSNWASPTTDPTTPAPPSGRRSTQGSPTSCSGSGRPTPTTCPNGSRRN